MCVEGSESLINSREGKIMAFYVALGVQSISLFLGLIGIYMLFKNLSSPESKFLLAASLCVEVFGIGYLFEMEASNYGEAIIAIMVQSAGLAYVGLMFAIYTTYLTKAIKVPSIVWKILFAVKTGESAIIFTSKFHNLYFEGQEFVDTGLFPHLEGPVSIIRIIFLVSLAGLLSFGVLQLIMARIHTVQIRKKKRYTLAIVGCSIPLLGMIVSLLGDFEGYEPTSAMTLLAVFGIAVVRSRDVATMTIQTAYNELYNQSAMGILLTDSEGLFLDCNRRALEINPNLQYINLGTSCDEVLSMGGVILDKELRRLYSEGRVFSENEKELVEKGKVIGHILTYTDITEIEKQLKVYEELKKEADSASEAKTAFLANMSHEMRTPLNAIIGLAELSVREDSIDDIKKYVTQMKSSGQVLLDIISDVLDFSKVESGKLEIVPTEYELKDLVNTIVNMTNVRIDKKEIDFSVRINPQIPNLLLGDDVRIRQIFVNFLSNAAKYTERGYIKLEIGYEETADGIVLKCAVEDSGKGIKEDEIPNLFKVFSRVDLKSNRNIQGTGLGLAISAQLIELMNGTYSVTSEYGMGSRFSFNIPQKVISDKAIGTGQTTDILVKRYAPFELFAEVKDEEEIVEVQEEKNSREEEIKSKCKGKSFMIVDDNAINIKVLAALLKLFDIEADSAMSGRDSIELMKSKKYDLIFMDHMMPGMDGIEAAKLMRDLPVSWAATVTIVACTANAVKGAEEMFRSNGMNDYICKPIIIEDLLAVLERNL